MAVTNIYIVLIYIVVSIGFWLLNRLQRLEHEKTRVLLLDHQKWLFEQLYAIKPGAILAPDDPKEENEQDQPAIVTKIGDDGMDEFNGSRDDWH